MQADPLVIRRLEFLGGMATGGGWRPPGDLPEVAFAGRSNSGKSSLLNLLFRRRAFARVSNTPGRTQEINFFRVNDAFVFADLPGYGYARVAREKRQDWRSMIDHYLGSTSSLRGVVLLLDVRREPGDHDLGMLDDLAERGLPVLGAITKVDKLTTAVRREQVAMILGKTGLEPGQVVECSSRTGEGRDELAAAVASLLEEPAWRSV
ncbi:MAG: ribosome biogenesis GTP-binding protein YihA/YsxC [Gemmatimonadota bacterium]